MIEWSISDLIKRETVNASPRMELARTSFEQGPDRSRNRFTSLLANVSFVSQMTEEQHEEFKEFYEITLLHGAKWFRRPLWQTAFFSYDCHFIGNGYQESDRIGCLSESDSDSMLWEVSMTLEVRGYYIRIFP